MKKIVSIVSVVLMLVCLIAIYVSAEVTYISDLQIPYAVTAPVLDGTLSTGEWTDAAKFELPSSKMMVVQMDGLATTAPADLVINTYMKWVRRICILPPRLPAIRTADVSITARPVTIFHFTLMLTG